MIGKNVFRLIKKKKFQIVGICLIIFLSSFIYVGMYNAINSIEKSLKEFVAECNREDYSCDVIEYDDCNKINDFKNYYDLDEVELRKSKDIHFDYKDESYKIRALTDQKVIDLTKVEKGRKPINNNEIGLPKVFLESNNLRIGDTIQINQKNYLIVSEVLFPDYTVLMFNKEPVIDNKRITVCLFTKEEYQSLKGNEIIKISIKTDKELLEEDVLDKFTNVSSVVKTSNNMTSGYIDNEIIMTKKTMAPLCIVICLIAVIITIIIIYKILQSEKKEIGVLKALGYKNCEIIRPYLLFVIIISSIGLILGAIIGTISSQKIIDLFAMFYLFPNEGVKFEYSVYFIGVLVPFIIFCVLSYIIVYRLINKKPLELLKNINSKESSFFTKNINKLFKKLNTFNKFKYSFLLKEKGKFYTLILSMLFSSLLITVTLMMAGLYDKMTAGVYNNFDYEYEAATEIREDDALPDCYYEKALNIPIKYNKKVVTLKGLEPDNKLYKIQNDKSEDVTNNLSSESSVVVTKSFALLNDIKKGDTIKLVINKKEKEFHVTDISKQYGTPEIYISREVLSDLCLGNCNDLYNMIFTKEKPNSEEFEYIISKEALINQSKTMQKFILISVITLGIVSILIASIVIATLSSLTVEGNYYNIALLKMLGYTKKEIKRLIFSTFCSYSIITYLLSAAFFSKFLVQFMRDLSKEFDIVLPFEFRMWQLIIGLLIVILIYYIGTASSKRKLDKIALQEVIKEYSK